MKPQFTVTISAPDGKSVKRFYGLNAAAANRAIAYASRQLGRAICRNVSDEWLSEVGCLAVSAVCDYGRMIEIYQIVNSTGPWLSPGEEPSPKPAAEVDCDADPVRNEWNGIGPDCLPDSDFWKTAAQRCARDIQELRAKGYDEESIGEMLAERASEAGAERAYLNRCGGVE